MLSLFEEAFGWLRKESIIGREQTFAQFNALIFTRRQPSATSLVLGNKFAPFELRSAGADFRHSHMGSAAPC